MSFLAKLYVEVNGSSISDESSDNGINVLRCSFQFSMSINLSTGLTQGRVQAGLIKVEVESSKSTGLLGWILHNERGDGKIVFHRREAEDTKEKELEFENARLVDYKETFNAVNSLPMITNLEIFAEKIHINDERDFSTIEWTDHQVST